MIDTRTTAMRYAEPEHWQNYIKLKSKSKDLVLWWDMFKLAGGVYVELVKEFPNKEIIIKYNIFGKDDYQAFLKIQTYVEGNGVHSLALLIDELSMDYCAHQANQEKPFQRTEPHC